MRLESSVPFNLVEHVELFLNELKSVEALLLNTCNLRLFFNGKYFEKLKLKCSMILAVLSFLVTYLIHSSFMIWHPFFRKSKGKP